jgi:MFS transporter, DHA2 family, multidrug resistance protein
VAGSMLTPLLVRRARPGTAMAAGLALAAVGFGLLTLVDGTSGLGVLVAGSVVFSLGVAPVGTLATDVMVGAAPPERAGAAAAISETGGEFGGALGIAVLGSIGAAVYRGQVADAVPAGVPPDAAEAARDTLGGAVVAAEQLGGELGAALLDAARQAFAQGLRLTAVVSAVLTVAVAVLAATLLGSPGVGGAAPGGPAELAEGAEEAAG